jgi:low affinity Fe/Cu permease
MGCERAGLSLFGHVAARHKYRDDHHHVPMVFLIQNTQNRDGAALQAKLDELIRAHHDARNNYMGIEKLPEEELAQMREHCADEATTAGSPTAG